MIKKIARVFAGWKILIISSAAIMASVGVGTFVRHVDEIKRQIESAFQSRAQLIERFMEMNIEQTAVMRNRFVEAYEDYHPQPAPFVESRPDLGDWEVKSALGLFSGDAAQPVDDEVMRQMWAAEGMKAQLTATAALNKEAAWQYYFSARHFMFAATDADSRIVRFQRAYYTRPYWLQAEPKANPTGRVILAGPYQDLWGKGLVLTIAQPVYVGTRFMGIACLDLQTRTLSQLVKVGEAEGETLLISENDHLIASAQGGSTEKIERPPISARLLEWDDDDKGYLWLSGEVVKNEMWIVHKVSRAQIYRAAAKESLSVWLMLLVLATFAFFFKRVVDLLRQISQLSFRDPLTGLPNRRVLEDRLEQAILRAKRDKARAVVFFIDLDKFKPVNDLYGHEAGDWLLKQVAQRMQGCLRQSDTVARVGGDEFVVLLPRCPSREDAVQVAEKIRAELNRPFPRDDGTVLAISSSIGVAFYPDCAESGRELLRFGDEAMYQAKKAGRDRVVVFDGAATTEDGFVRLNWNDGYRSGNAEIDAEHQELFRLGNALFDAMSSMDKPDAALVLAAFDALLAHTTQHFADEEALLRQRDYPGAEAHAARHAQLLRKALELRQHAQEGSLSLADAFDFLAQQLITNHLLTEDAKFFPLFQAPSGAR